MKLWKLRISVVNGDGVRQCYTEEILARTPDHALDYISERWKSLDPRLEEATEIPMDPTKFYRIVRA